MLCLSIFSIVVIIFRANGENRDNLAKLHFLSSENGAVCLDGSKAAYYREHGFDKGRTKWLLHFEGGSWCTNSKACLDRSTNPLGSSKSYAKTMNFEAMSNYFSRNYTDNLMFHNWNMIYIKYCDGGSFTGDTEEKYQGKTLNYRGNKIVLSLLQDLAAKGMENATEIVVSGVSAGGLAALIHVDRIKEHFPKSLVVALVDSGFFYHLDEDRCPSPFNTSQVQMYHLMNSSAGLNVDCLDNLEANQEKCLDAFEMLRFVNSPVFALQSAVDTFEISNILCAKHEDTDEIETFRSNFENQFMGAFYYEKGLLHSAVLDYCPRHGGFDINWKTKDFWNEIADSTGATQHRIFSEWYRHLHYKHKYKRPGHMSIISVNRVYKQPNHGTFPHMASCDHPHKRPKPPKSRKRRNRKAANFLRAVGESDR